MVHTPLATSHCFRRVTVLVLWGIHWGPSEARSTTTQYDDDEHDSGGGLPSIPESEEGGHPSPNATMSEGAAAEVAQKLKAAEIQRLSPVKSSERVRASHGSLTVISTLWDFLK